MFAQNAIVYVTKVQVKKNYSLCNIVSYYQNQDKTSEKDFSYCVVFYGDAHNNKPKVGDKIQILSCGVKNTYFDKTTNTIKYRKPQFMIFDYKLLDAGERLKPEDAVRELEFDLYGDLPF